MTRMIRLASVVPLLLLVTGCAIDFGEQAQHGITFYCPGAGNVDLGDGGVRAGLEKAGYKGQVASVTWTFSLNPAIDQAVRVNARLAGTRLARYIEEYKDKFPDGEVNIIGLSAGTGVAIWALEDLNPDYQVENVVLLSSSLSRDYDVSTALERVKGKIYNYYSPNDVVLTTFMLPFGTIDGKLGAEGAGAAGLAVPEGSTRVVNIRWRPDFERFGYNGGHTDATNPRFVRHHLSRHILSRDTATAGETNAASPLAQAPPDAD